MKSEAESASDEAEQAAEAAFTPSMNITPPTNVTPMPTPATTQAASIQAAASGEEVQQKIAALQRQLSELAKSKA